MSVSHSVNGPPSSETIDVVASDARAGAVGAGPGDGDARAGRRRRHRVDRAGRKRRVDGDQGLLGRIDPLARVLVVDLVGGDRLALSNVMLATLRICVPVARPALGPMVKPTKPIPRPLPSSGGRKPVSRLAGGRSVLGSIDWSDAVKDARGRVQVQVDRGPRRSGRSRSCSRWCHSAASRPGSPMYVLPKPTAAELEGAPIEVRIELVGDIDTLGRGRGAGVVLEEDLVGEQRPGDDEIDARCRGPPMELGSR